MKTRTLLHVGPFGLSESNLRLLRDSCAETDVAATHDGTPLELLGDSGFDVIVAEEMPHNLSDWPRLRFIQLVSAGINHLQGHPVWNSDIVVANASGTHSVPIAQYVTCAVLMLAHRMPDITSPAATRQWKRDGLECGVLRGRIAGIIGYGSVGRESARQLHALGMRVYCMKRNPAARRDEGFSAWPGTGDPEGDIPERWFGPADMQEFLPHCDSLVVTVPCTSATLGMIRSPEIALMKPTANLINVARGGIVDEADLSEALHNRRLAGAMIDCFSTEPIPSDHLFHDTPNLILTPHMAGVSDLFWPTMAQLLQENLRRFIAGDSILNRVNPSLEY